MDRSLNDWERCQAAFCRLVSGELFIKFQQDWLAFALLDFSQDFNETGLGAPLAGFISDNLQSFFHSIWIATPEPQDRGLPTCVGDCLSQFIREFGQKNALLNADSKPAMSLAISLGPGASRRSFAHVPRSCRVPANA